jgi:two-component system phosphate regulon sensor histidine kinase PhoR
LKETAKANSAARCTPKKGKELTVAILSSAGRNGVKLDEIRIWVLWQLSVTRVSRSNHTCRSLGLLTKSIVFPMDKAVPSTARQVLSAPARDVYAAQIRLLVVLVLCFAVLPGMLIISVGILVLVFGHQPHDFVFGTLIVSLAVAFVAGITATVLYVRRGTSLARLQAEFVQKVSHDLRTPLTSIRMFVETLQGGRLTDPERVRECLEVLSQETGRLTAMVERLLKWARMEAGKRTYLVQAVSVSTLIETALQGLEAQVLLHPVDGELFIEKELSTPTPLVEVDADAMSEALLNLLQNAVRYTGRSKKIKMSCQAQEREVIISVSDNGPGIARHEHRRIFEKFYRVVDPANPHVEGSGLGLAIVHHVVRAHRGRITVESDLGRGATFRIILPAFPAPEREG